jgi:hypothetical protein
MNKIENEELELLKKTVSEINNLQMQIGGVEAQKHELLHAIANANGEFQKIQKDLEEKYGKVSVNLNTGEITEDESNKED